MNQETGTFAEQQPFVFNHRLASVFSYRKFVDDKTFTYIDASLPLGDPNQQWRKMEKGRMRNMFHQALGYEKLSEQSRDAIQEVLAIMAKEAN
jgi:hypothetical protein